MKNLLGTVNLQKYEIFGTGADSGLMRDDIFFTKDVISH